MIDWIVEVEDVDCPADDMRKMAWMAVKDLVFRVKRGEGRTMMEGTNRWYDSWEGRPECRWAHARQRCGLKPDIGRAEPSQAWNLLTASLPNSVSFPPLSQRAHPFIFPLSLPLPLHPPRGLFSAHMVQRIICARRALRLVSQLGTTFIPGQCRDLKPKPGWNNTSWISTHTMRLCQSQWWETEESC